MKFSIYKVPTGVTRSALPIWFIYIFVVFAFLRNDSSFPIFMLCAVLGLTFLLLRSFGAYFISSIDVTTTAARLVTSAGGVIEIRRDQIDHMKSKLSAKGLVLVSLSADELHVPAVEYRDHDIDRLATWAGLTGAGKFLTP